ncbi:DUF4062 domain-containing protein [Chryseobacterium gambrini]|uniref:DUF4062 domain-containing protein n=1 Tax=Chryseobacterium gambrini TaxID=373672 RepID=A0A1N7P7I7_9FLAO|nr:DUF4062 domain-containing protein [Chryseobacterium gambrini]SIT06486.1 protein of unknown function [Chryseobacterium gambrini]
MAALKIFVSSTCYDLNIIRGQMRTFLSSSGHEPIMSDYNDVLFDPRIHTHESCVQEVKNADIIILIIGSRFGGTAIPKITSNVDIEGLKSQTRGTKIFDTIDKLSITQLEILNAIESDIPIFTFVDSRVSYDHHFYEKNKNKGIIDQLDFPSIDKKDTAIYIFEFINFLRLRSKNNSVIDFSKFSDIEDYLRKQFSSLLQRLLFEQRNKVVEEKRLDFLSKQIEDIKTAILTTIPSDELKETAKGAIQFRGIIEFLLSFRNIDNIETIALKNIDWQQLITELGIVEFSETRDKRRKYSKRLFAALIRNDRKFYITPYELSTLFSFISEDWNEFSKLPDQRKTALLNAIKDNFIARDINRGIIFIEETFEEYQRDLLEQADDEE